MSTYRIRPVLETDRETIARLTADSWGADLVVVHGQSFRISQLSGFIAEQEGQISGLISYQIQGEDCEITSLESFSEGIGIGATLIEAVKTVAQQQGCIRLMLTTTNDNTHAIRFYQRRGFRLAALRIGAVNESRKIKPQIPLLGNDDIPICDELDFTLDLQNSPV